MELRKFKRGKRDIPKLLDMREAWCYVLKWFEEMSEKERELFAKKNRGMEDIMDWTKPLSLREQEYILAEAREKNRRNRAARELYVFQEGMEKGRAEGIETGMEKGRAEGIETGMEKGRAEGMQAVALNMLKEQADIAFICKVTGLSIDEIQNLKKSSC